jgi:hypothetical protein
MSLPRRSAPLILLLGTALLLGFFFRNFVFENFVWPLALVVWVFWSDVLSVHQMIYWVLLILSLALYAFFRNARRSTDTSFTPSPDSNATLEEINRWRIVIPLTSDEIETENILKQNLGKMLTVIYTSRQPESAHWEVEEALRQRRIPIPESIYRFLFPAGPAEKAPFLLRMARDILQAPGKLARRWSGRETAGYYRSIEEVLTYMESLMEKKHDGKPFGTHPH